MKQLTITTLVPPAILLVMATMAFADVQHFQRNSLNRITHVSDAAWQPEGFDAGQAVPAKHVDAPVIELDGLLDESAWKSAEVVRVPLSHGSVTEAEVRAIYSTDEVFLAVSWPDATEDREHRPWVLDADAGSYRESNQLEDALLLSFEAGCEWFPSLLGGYVYDFDGWQWLAARSDPLGQALDLMGHVQDRDHPNLEFEAYDSRNRSDAWNVKYTDKDPTKLHASWDELDRSYMLQPVTTELYIRGKPDGYHAPEFVRQVMPPQIPQPDGPERITQFEPVVLEGEAGEVAAKGHWEDGRWTVEFKRVRMTPAGSINDTSFNRLTQFSIHVFDRTERVDQSSESGRLYLRFIPRESRVAID